MRFVAIFLHTAYIQYFSPRVYNVVRSRSTLQSASPNALEGLLQRLNLPRAARAVVRNIRAGLLEVALVCAQRVDHVLQLLLLGPRNIKAGILIHYPFWPHLRIRSVDRQCGAKCVPVQKIIKMIGGNRTSAWPYLV